MIRKYILYILFLLGFYTLSSHIVFAAVKVSFYTSYGAEVKRANSDTWDFIKVEMELNATDTIRIPPDVILYVTEDAEVIKIPHGREGFVDDLIKEVKQRKEKAKTKGGQPSQTQILETDYDASKSKDIEIDQKERKDVRKPLDINLLDSLASIDKSILNGILQVIPEPSNIQYPYRNFGYARRLFEKLQKEIRIGKKATPSDRLQTPEETWKTKTADEIEFEILYLALLRGLEIEANFKQNDKGDIFVLFDSGISAKQVKRITANRTIYQSIRDNVWLPLHITPSSKNFIVSWYYGGAALKAQ